MGADSQSAGRGRHGRDVGVAAGGRHLRVDRAAAAGPRRVRLLTLAAGVAVAEGIQAASGAEARREVAQRRLPAAVAGPAKGGRHPGRRRRLGHPVDYVVIGIGVNVRTGGAAADVADRATSIEGELGRPVERGAVVAEVCAGLWRRYRQLVGRRRRRRAGRVARSRRRHVRPRASSGTSGGGTCRGVAPRRRRVGRAGRGDRAAAWCGSSSGEVRWRPSGRAARRSVRRGRLLPGGGAAPVPAQPGHLVRIVGPSFDLVCGWAARGVPLRVALPGIDRYVERQAPKGPRRRPDPGRALRGRRPGRVRRVAARHRRAAASAPRHDERGRPPAAAASLRGAPRARRRPPDGAARPARGAGRRRSHRGRDRIVRELDGVRGRARRARAARRARRSWRAWASWTRELLASRARSTWLRATTGGSWRAQAERRTASVPRPDGRRRVRRRRRTRWSIAWCASGISCRSCGSTGVAHDAARRGCPCHARHRTPRRRRPDAGAPRRPDRVRRRARFPANA